MDIALYSGFARFALLLHASCYVSRGRHWAAQGDPWTPPTPDQLRRCNERRIIAYLEKHY